MTFALLVTALVCFTLVAAQSPTVVDLSSSIAQLTYATTEGSLSPGSLTNNEQTFVYQKTSSASDVGTVFSVPTSATTNTSSIALSIPSSNSPGGLAFSPNQDYVTYLQVGALYATPIAGGTPRLLSPPDAIVGTYSWKQCACGSSNSDQSQLLISAQLNGTSGLWANNVNGNALTQINVPLQGTDAQGKVLTLLAAFSDYIVYAANPGVNLQSDPYNMYLADWSGNSFLMSPAGTLIYPSTRPLAIYRSPNGCAPTGRYIAFTGNGGNITFSQLYVYDTTDKVLLNGGAPINPPVSVANEIGQISWSADGTKLYFVWTAATTTDVLYEWNTVTQSALKVVSTADYSTSTGQRRILVSAGASKAPNVNLVGDYLVFSQRPITGNFTHGVFSYNTVTGSLSSNFFPSVPVDTSQANVRSFRIYPGPELSSIDSNSAQLVFVVVTSFTPSTQVVYSVPVAGGTANALSTPNVASSTIIQTISTVVCPTVFAANCNLAAIGCQCASCAQPSCSNYVAFTQTDQFGNLQLFSVQSTGSNAVRLSPANSFSLTGTLRHLTPQQGNVPYIAFQAIVSGSQSGRQVFFALASASSATLVSSGIAAPAVNGTGTSSVSFTADGNWLVFLSNTFSGVATFPSFSTQLELFTVSTTAISQTPVRLSPALTSAQSVSAWKISPNVKFCVISVLEQAAGARPLTSLLYSATLAVSPNVVNVTPRNNLTGSGNADPLTSAVSTGAFDCASNSFYYGATLSYNASGSATSLYAVPVIGGNTYLLSFGPSSGAAVAAFTVARSSNRVGFFASPGGVLNAYWNDVSVFTPTTTTTAVVTTTTPVSGVSTTRAPTTTPAAAAWQSASLLLLTTLLYLFTI